MKKYSKEQLLLFYREMQRVRKMEEKIYEMYLNSQLYGMSPHLYIGEESIAVGVCQNLRKDDYIVSTHRGHGHCLAKGAKLDRILAEICGKDTGYCHGLGGSMHIADVETGNLGANGIVGAGLPIGVGAGLSAKYRGTDQVSICFFGDATSNHGTFHESLNFATAFKLPVVFVCENNLYGLSTFFNRVSATPDVADRAKAYDIPGVSVDGMDVIKGYEESKKLVDRARAGNGPSLIECKTYRFLGHGSSDNRSYRTREEEEQWKKKCPVCTFRAKAEKESGIAKTEFDKIDAEIDTEIQTAVEFAFASPEPGIDRIKENIYYEQ
jgi:TPP-dependent pyruvate/acetoin dehydrogenase alpha subunit